MRAILLLLIAMTLIACTPKIQKAGLENNKPVLTDTALFTSDGHRLPVKIWPAGVEEKAIIIAVHGFNDYRNGFSFPASWWMQHGISTYAYDQRGFGETENVGIWAPVELLVADLETLVREVQKKKPGIPVYLLGESMGGAVVMAAVTKPGFPPVSGAILSAPAVWGWESLNLGYRSLLWTTAHTIPYFKPSSRGLGVRASDNTPMLQNLGADPFFIKNTRIDSIYGLVGLMDHAYFSAEKMTLPTLVLYGANDQIIPKKPVENVVSRLPESADIVLYKEGWHLLMRDLQAATVWRDILSWTETGTIPSGNKVTSFPLFAGNS
ncbi:MAG: lysophospholipase [Sneathiella sp.]